MTILISSSDTLYRPVLFISFGWRKLGYDLELDLSPRKKKRKELDPKILSLQNELIKQSK
jgi:hypothetical protein